MSGGTIAPETPRNSLTLLRLFADHPKAFWRHDVDVSLEAAVRMARVAQTAGVTSTFYLNPRSEFYNVFSPAGARACIDILEAGHTIGLHCNLDGRPPREAVRADQDLMRPPTDRVSFHMPNSLVLWRDFPDFENAYASKWEGRYVADSRGHTPDFSDVGDGDGWQINLHPEWWDL